MNINSKLTVGELIIILFKIQKTKIKLFIFTRHASVPLGIT